LTRIGRLVGERGEREIEGRKRLRRGVRKSNGEVEKEG
jgi:hypothetical protein